VSFEKLTEDWLSVLVVDESIVDLGILANAAFVMGLTMGRHLPLDTFGPDVKDANGVEYAALTALPHHVRKASKGQLRTLHTRAIAAKKENIHVLVVAYPLQAATSSYLQYTADMALSPTQEMQYRAVHVAGPNEVVRTWTKNLSRL
jgi:hypothetical protein